MQHTFGSQNTCSDVLVTVNSFVNVQINFERSMLFTWILRSFIENCRFLQMKEVKCCDCLSLYGTFWLFRSVAVSCLSVPTYTTIPDFPTGSLRNVNFHALINTLLVYPPAIRLNWWNCFSPGSRCVMRCLKAQSLSAPGAPSLNNTVVTPLVPREKLINSLPRQLMAHI